MVPKLTAPAEVKVKPSSTTLLYNVVGVSLVTMSTSLRKVNRPALLACVIPVVVFKVSLKVVAPAKLPKVTEAPVPSPTAVLEPTAALNTVGPALAQRYLTQQLVQAPQLVMARGLL